MNLNLKNKNALVCGSTQGIGKATAIALANEGAKVTLVARNRDKLKQVLAELPDSENHSFIVADFTNPRDLQEKIIKFIDENHGFLGTINSGFETKDGGAIWTKIDLGRACNKIRIYKDNKNKSYSYLSSKF